MDESNNPHDVYFRERFTRREIAQDFLRQQRLAELLEVVDLDSLEISKDSDVSKELRASYSDLVYRLKWRVPDQADPAVPEQANPGAAVDLEDAAATLALHVYILFEHKSRPDDWVLLQLLRYIVLQGEAEILLRLMERTFGPTDARLRQQIQEADAETLLAWSERILTAETPEAVFHECRDQRCPCPSRNARASY
ncbi:Rpn family recombination-promoting nuclease/putative transposase [Lamprobacter modestohalophilus]|nr:Rpn family recombination-promoting nuclease/putative transposase [Lamprobacter modestohalophilus]